MRVLGALFLSIAALSCSDGSSPTEVAKTAYLGLDPSIDKAISLGFQGFNAALGANIPPQTAGGGVSGTMTITGQVDQGTSVNKTMRLGEALDSYSDDGQITYTTSATEPPTLNMDLKNIPNGTVSGTLDGNYTMAGALSGDVTLSVTFSGAIEPGASASQVQRVPGTTRVVGTAKSGSGTYSIDITR